jgi:hypothetical protein
MRKLLLACALLAIPALSAAAANNPWIGTWKLDPAKSHFTGDTFTYSKAANGLIHFSDGSTENFDFAIDGKEYKTVYGRTTSWTASGNNAWDSVTKFNGTVLVNVHRQISPDGKTLTFVETGTKPDGSSFKDESVYSRLSGGPGLLGKWQSVKVNISAPDTFIIQFPTPDTIKWDIPGYKELVEGKADGSDLPITGPTVSGTGLTLSVKLDSPHKLSYIVKSNGKPVEYGVQTLAEDGKSYTDVSWNPGKENEKQSGVYIKQ